MIFDMEANPTEPTERMKKALWTYNEITGDQNSIDSNCYSRLSRRCNGSINPQKTGDLTESRL